MCDKEDKDMTTKVREDEIKLTFMDDIKHIIRKSIDDKGISTKEVRKSFGVKRYEK